MKERKPSLADLGIDKTWTLFLDRDGVINERVKGDYVREWSQFRFLPSALNALRRLSSLFGRIVIVTNQRGVARNLIRTADLADINERMMGAISEHGGRVDKVYVCPHDLTDHCGCRKPNSGLAYEAQRDYPSIVFNRAVMVGDDSSDIMFARRLGMTSVLVRHDDGDEGPGIDADYFFSDLFDFASSIQP